VREGLRRLVRRAGLPPADDAGPTGARTRWRNGLLDLVGSDARPLADLLLRVEAHGVAAAIPAGPLAPAAWAPVRARLAFAYAAETFLDAEMARWAVDAWAYATGAIDAGGLYVAPPVVSPVAPPVVLGAVPVGARPAVAGGGAPMYPAPASATPVYGSPAFGAPALPAGVTARPGKIPGRVRRAMARANAPPAPNPFPKNFDRIAGLTFMGMVAAAAGAMWMGIAERREAGGLEAPAPVHAEFAGVGAPAPAIAPLVGGAAVAPAGVAPDGGGAAASRGAGAREAGASLGVDSLRLRDGTVRTGVVERVTPDGLVVRDPWSDVSARLGFDSIVEWRPRPGERVPVGAPPGGADADGTAATDGGGLRAAPLEGAPESGAEISATAADAVPDGHPPVGASAAAYGGPPGAGDLGHRAIVAGLAGRYTVRRRVLDVAGSESCGAVAAAVRRSAPTVETVAHRPGEAEFALTSRPGLRGVVDDDGRFRTGVVTGERGGVQYRFRMVGQFLPDGWRAETESETRAVLRWGDVQQCRVSVALEASRLP
jgi:hypothetical protein